MFDDPIVKEIRKIRHEIEAECNHDPDEYLKRLKKVEEQYQDRLVRREPQPALQRTVGE